MSCLPYDYPIAPYLFVPPALKVSSTSSSPAGEPAGNILSPVEVPLGARLPVFATQSA